MNERSGEQLFRTLLRPLYATRLRVLQKASCAARRLPHGSPKRHPGIGIATHSRPVSQGLRPLPPARSRVCHAHTDGRTTRPHARLRPPSASLFRRPSDRPRSSPGSSRQKAEGSAAGSHVDGDSRSLASPSCVVSSRQRMLAVASGSIRSVSSPLYQD